jgi:hypothetical protein
MESSPKATCLLGVRAIHFREDFTKAGTGILNAKSQSLVSLRSVASFAAKKPEAADALHPVGRDRTRQQTNRRPLPPFRRTFNWPAPCF